MRVGKVVLVRGVGVVLLSASWGPLSYWSREVTSSLVRETLKMDD